MQLKVSVIIPHREGESIVNTLAGVYLSDYPKDKIEIFQAEGTHPTVQRNACIKEAGGDIIYFIDNDSIIDKDNIKIAVELFEKDENIAVIGGPAIHTITTNMERYIDNCLCSYFAVGPIASRYSKQNTNVREGTDRDVILCNLFIKKEVLFEAGLFNEELYPNEENALIDKIMSLGYKLIYNPNILVKRPPRSNTVSYIKMLLNYGRGRLEQLVREFNIKNIIFVIPMLFAFYTVLIPIIFTIYIYTNSTLMYLYFLPFLLYLLITFIVGIFTSFKDSGFFNKIKGIFIYPFMFFITHFFYGLGFFYGILNICFGAKRVARFTVNKHKSFGV